MLSAIDLGIRIFIGVVFGLAAIGKMRHRAFARFSSSLAEYGIPSKRRRLVAVSVISAESTVAGGVVARPVAVFALILAAILISCVTGAAVLALRRGQQPMCNCFGGREARLMGGGEIARNTAIAIIALAGIGSLAVHGHGSSAAAGIAAGGIGVLAALGVATWDDIAHILTA